MYFGDGLPLKEKCCPCCKRNVKVAADNKDGEFDGIGDIEETAPATQDTDDSKLDPSDGQAGDA